MGFVSIFNDVMGPVMRGPSSSHTAGAYRIAQIVRSLAGENPKSIRCTFDPDGSYASTYLPLGVDLAFAVGFLGWKITDSRYLTALQATSKAGIDLSFAVAQLKHADHPNAVRIEMGLQSGERLTVWAKATGGGAVEFYRLNEWEVNIDGKYWAILVLAERSRKDELHRHMQKLLGQGGTVYDQTRENEVFIQGKSSRPIAVDAERELKDLPQVCSVRSALPVFLPFHRIYPNIPGEHLVSDSCFNGT